MQQLSSKATPLLKFALPGMFLIACPITISLAFQTSREVLPAAFWTLACAFLLWWTFPIKKLSLPDDHEHFVISNYLREIRVPVTTLARVKVDSWNRTPNIILYFDPTTEFGSKVRVIPRSGWFNYTAKLLTGLRKKENADGARLTT